MFHFDQDASDPRRTHDGAGLMAITSNDPTRFSRNQLAVRAVLWSCLLCTLPVGLRAAGTFAERESLWMALSGLAILVGILIVPCSVLLTALSLRLPRALRAPPWLASLAGPPLMAVACALLAGRHRLSRFMWIADGVDLALQALFVFGNLVLIALTAWHRTRRWDLPALVWSVSGSALWLLVCFSVPHGDVIGEGLAQELALLPLWALTFSPCFVLWTLHHPLVAQQLDAADSAGRARP
jgi:hypothetical protein